MRHCQCNSQGPPGCCSQRGTHGGTLLTCIPELLQLALKLRAINHQHLLHVATLRVSSLKLHADRLEATSG